MESAIFHFLMISPCRKQLQQLISNPREVQNVIPGKMPRLETNPFGLHCLFRKNLNVIYPGSFNCKNCIDLRMRMPLVWFDQHHKKITNGGAGRGKVNKFRRLVPTIYTVYPLSKKLSRAELGNDIINEFH